MYIISIRSMSYATVITLCITTLFLYSYGASSSSPILVSAPFAIGSRSLLRSIVDDKAEEIDYVVELNATNFDSVLKETAAIYAVVEFFAHWCPACRNYKPHYEKVAKLFNGANAAHPGIILITRVDCALKVNTKLCDKFSVRYCPMLLWGPPLKFASGSWDPKQEQIEIRSIDEWRTADHLLSWINNQTNSSYRLDDEKYESGHRQTNASDFGQIALAMHDIEEATSTAFDIILNHKMIKSDTRASLVKFFQLLVVHHPSRRCRKGTAEILVDFDVFLDNKTETTIGNYQICGDVPRGNWMFCRGSKIETRGYSCGLWVLLHSLSVRVDDGESQMAFTAICDFIHTFFNCEECRQHFYNMCSSVSNHPFKKARDFVLWLWNAHNKVNNRLIKEEASLGTGDPKFPKIMWPPRQLCPSCYLNRNDGNSLINWDEDEVYKFLIGYYGKTLVTEYKDKEFLLEERVNSVHDENLSATPHAVVVPVGTVLVIAVASCGFGALACYWNQRQKKNRKKKYHLHSLKMI